MCERLVQLLCLVEKKGNLRMLSAFAFVLLVVTMLIPDDFHLVFLTGSSDPRTDSSFQQPTTVANVEFNAHFSFLMIWR